MELYTNPSSMKNNGMLFIHTSSFDFLHASNDNQGNIAFFSSTNKDISQLWYADNI